MKWDEDECDAPTTLISFSRLPEVVRRLPEVVEAGSPKSKVQSPRSKVQGPKSKVGDANFCYPCFTNGYRRQMLVTVFTLIYLDLP